jgi:hypothetical protein
MSTPVSGASVGTSAITVSPGGTSVAGTVSLSSDRTTLTLTPSNLLAASTAYTVQVSGFTDQAGNTVTPFTSSFTTGTSGTANAMRPSAVSANPAYGASGVAVSSTIVLTFNEAIDPTTVNDTTVPISVSGFSGALAESYALDDTGMVLTFTPLSPLSGNANIRSAGELQQSFRPIWQPEQLVLQRFHDGGGDGYNRTDRGGGDAG